MLLFRLNAMAGSQPLNGLPPQQLMQVKQEPTSGRGKNPKGPSPNMGAAPLVVPPSANLQPNYVKNGQNPMSPDR